MHAWAARERYLYLIDAAESATRACQCQPAEQTPAGAPSAMHVLGSRHWIAAARVGANSSVVRWTGGGACKAGIRIFCHLLRPGLVTNFNPQIPLCKKKIPITSKCRHMYGVLNVDEVKN
jgi:hypothetical protein